LKGRRGRQEGNRWEKEDVAAALEEKPCQSHFEVVLWMTGPLFVSCGAGWAAFFAAPGVQVVLESGFGAAFFC
jgi:hypothetical protein